MTTPTEILSKKFSFPEFVLTSKKSTQFIYSFLRKNIFLETHGLTCHAIFGHAHPNIFCSTINFHKFVPIWEKSGYFIILC